MNFPKTVSTIPDVVTLHADPPRLHLQDLSREIKDEIVSHLLPTQLNTIRLVSHDLQVSALHAWRLEIPKAKRTALTAIDSRPSAGTWRQAWLSQCTHLETLGPWGAQASHACKFLPDGLNPYDVESQCRQWLDSEIALGGTQAETVLEELFTAIHENKTFLDWSGRNLHSLPPFVNKAKALQGLDLRNNQLNTIDIKDLPALRRLYLGNNQLNAIDLKDLPALRGLFLNNNQHHLVGPEYRHAVR